MTVIHKFFLRFRPYRRLIDLMRIITLPGFERVPVFNVVSFFLREIAKEDLNVRASALSFNFFLALFPATIFFFTFIAYLPIANSHDQILQFFSEVLPASAFLSIESTLEDILKHQRGSLLSFSMVMAVYFGTNGIHSMMNAFDKYVKHEHERSFFKQRLIATALLFFMSMLVIVAVTLITFGTMAFDKMLELKLLSDKLVVYALDGIKWVVILAVFFTLISSLYYWGPARAKRWRFVSPGSTLATILSIVTTLGFAYYVNNFNSYNKLYGSIGTLIVVLLLIYFNCVILLVGFELNSSIDKGLETRLRRPIPRINELLNPPEETKE